MISRKSRANGMWKRNFWGNSSTGPSMDQRAFSHWFIAEWCDVRVLREAEKPVNGGGRARIMINHSPTQRCPWVHRRKRSKFSTEISSEMKQDLRRLRIVLCTNNCDGNLHSIGRWLTSSVRSRAFLASPRATRCMSSISNFQCLRINSINLFRECSRSESEIGIIKSILIFAVNCPRFMIHKCHNFCFCISRVSFHRQGDSWALQKASHLDRGSTSTTSKPSSSVIINYFP